MGTMFWIWLVVVVVALVLELATMALTSVWFVGGGIVAMLLSIFEGIEWYWQALAFVVVSVALLLIIRPIAQKYFNKNSEGRTNMEIYMGQKVRMITAANFDTLGTAKIYDVIWTIKSDNGEELKVGEIVEIIAVSGNKLIAKKCGDNKETATKKD
mgnify:CR=1 FL=1